MLEARCRHLCLICHRCLIESKTYDRHMYVRLNDRALASSWLSLQDSVRPPLRFASVASQRARNPVRRSLRAHRGSEETARVMWLMDQLSGLDDETVVSELGLLAANMAACGLLFMLLSFMRIGDRSWYLTLYSSAATSIVGVIFFRSVLRDGLEASIMNENELSRFIALFFIGYCLMDLVLGAAYYEQAISYADGWMHHLLYVVICGVLLYRRMTGLFAVALIEELPIITLSFFEVQNKRKPSALFGMLYFVTRCFFHLQLIYAAAPFSKLVFATGAVLLRWHLVTFQQWVRGYLLRSSTRKRRLPFNAKIAFFLAAVVAQGAAHLLLASSRVLVLHQTGQMRAMTAHIMICLYFMYQLLTIVQDVYTQNFIMSAIGKKKIIYNVRRAPLVLFPAPRSSSALKKEREGRLRGSVGRASRGAVSRTRSAPPRAAAAQRAWQRLTKPR